jgi:hypothetical protein
VSQPAASDALLAKLDELIAAVGEERAETAAVRAEVAALRKQLAASGPAHNKERLLHPLRHVERTLAIHRSKLARHIGLGHIVVVKLGTKSRVTEEELRRVVREGLPEIEETPAPKKQGPRAKAPRRGARATSDPGEDILSIPIPSRR